MADYELVLDFWLGELDTDGRAVPEVSKLWWVKDSEFDGEIRSKFTADYEGIIEGDHDDWLASARGRVAYIIVLDQFSRNMFRDTAQMFSADALALVAARDGVAQGVDGQLRYAEKMFLYMPLMHAEDMAAQDLSIDVFTRLRDEAPRACREGAELQLGFASRHRAIVEKFGRYPHRNEQLGRKSTAEEREFLAKPGSSF